MKTILLITLVSCWVLIGFSQTSENKTNIKKNNFGTITSVEFPDTNILSKDALHETTETFFQKFLEVTSMDQFLKTPFTNLNREESYEHFDQFYNGIRVDGAGYNFHYKNGKMAFAHGHYVKIVDMDTHPSISSETAIAKFANFKKIPVVTIINADALLIISEIPIGAFDANHLTPLLVYQIRLYADNANNNEVGFIDAHSGEIVMTGPIASNIWGTGTFATRYSGTQQAITENYSGKNHLIDLTRGGGIHVRNLNGSTSPTYDESAEITDVDNNWTASEFHSNEDDMGLDIHWTLQKIYDHFLNTYAKNSFDNNGYPIKAYIHYGTNNLKDYSLWDPTNKSLFFGDGYLNFSPIASVDAVAHEYAHGITDFQVGWSFYSEYLSKFHEGLSDIWSAILEYRIRPNNIWKIGEQITLNKSCIRNIQSPGDASALQVIADTYQGPTYNQYSEYDLAGNYIQSGVFSHWFYLLVNGGSGTNELGNEYKVYGIGMDKAEDLLVKAVFGGYLRNASSYHDIRITILRAARDLCPNNNLLVNQIESAWYAVGVDAQPNIATTTGEARVCSSGSTYTVNNVPSGCTVTWNKSANLNLTAIPNSNQAFVSANGTGEAWIRATINSNCTNVVLPSLTVWAGRPIITGNSISNLLDMGYSNYYKMLAASGNYAFGGTLSAEVPLNAGINSYIWSYAGDIPGKNIAYWSASGKTVDVGAKTKNAGVLLSFKATNTCGSTYGNYTFFTGVIDEPVPLRIVPNPATTQAEVSFVDTNSETGDNTIQASAISNSPYMVTVMNSFGVSLYSASGSDKKFIIPTSSLKNGTYIVKITDGKNVQQGNLVVSH